MKILVACTLSACLAGPVAARAQQPGSASRQGAVPAGLSAATRQKLVDTMNRGAAYLKAQQKPDGTWENHPGITAMAAAALLRTPGRREAELKTVDKTLAYLRSLAKPDGGIYVKDIPHYITAVSAMTLAAANLPQDKPLLEKARKYLAENLLDEGEGVTPDNKFYGGLGYGGNTAVGQADIISLEFGLRAMKEAGTAPNDPAWDKALKFLQRTQNFEGNDQGWASNDGGFVYYPGNSQAGETRSYGSGSYAGIMSYAWSNVKKDDRRVQAVLKWVREHYTLEENPGIGTKALYYYYMVFAKALQAIGEPVIVDGSGARHNWRDDLAAKLASLQKPEGYWVNTDAREMQDNKVLVTAFTLMAIEAALE
jgi:squalene-hopene/tetraprenyl-beta-curcumene cyclase